MRGAIKVLEMPTCYEQLHDVERHEYLLNGLTYQLALTDQPCCFDVTFMIVTEQATDSTCVSSVDAPPFGLAKITSESFPLDISVL